jgi:two-component system, chemotaxis family, chemotaxis protein CheY
VNVEGSSAERTSARGDGQLVLVVEDDQVIRGVIADVLDDRGYRVVGASNGVEALEQFDRERPDAVVLDLLMPVMHGWEFMETYFEKTDGQAVPIVVVSVNPLLPRSYNRFGVTQCVGKPFQVDELVEAVEEALHPVAA